ncbi:UbiD family decarboxylase [Candidatus Micrarchaeota archaeon]|nr:UbiD family decarboxylase [Candidatus Micrarchaeota archaeon]
MEKNRLEKFIQKLLDEKRMVRIGKGVSERLEASSLLHALDGKPVYFPKVGESGFVVVGNLFSDRGIIAEYLGCSPQGLMQKLAHAIENPTKPMEVKDAPFMQNEISPVDLDALPLLFHYPKDGGKYLSSAIVVAQDEKYGRNCSFHRMMQIGKDTLVARILQRHLDEFVKRAENGISVPAESQIVMLGEITQEFADEGKFVDLTETYDVVRKQRVVKVRKIYYKNGAFYHALLPGCLEHKLLMGMPREPTIMREVSKACECVGVNVTPGGCSWLHAVVAIKKKSEGDGKKAIEAAFWGHKSLKLAIVVDEDVDIYDAAAVEWAIATRFQAKNGLVVKENENGSSLDPSADPNTRETSKMGIDATKPLVANGKDFTRAQMPKVDIGKYL